MRMLIKCKGCSKKFEKTGHNQLFHSKECASKHFKNSNHGKKIIRKNTESVKSPFKRFYKDRKTRKCLTCERDFKSEGSFNRVCIRCKHGEQFAWDMETYAKH